MVICEWNLSWTDGWYRWKFGVFHNSDFKVVRINIMIPERIDRLISGHVKLPTITRPQLLITAFTHSSYSATHLPILMLVALINFWASCCIIGNQHRTSVINRMGNRVTVLRRLARGLNSYSWMEFVEYEGGMNESVVYPKTVCTNRLQ